MTDEFTKLYKSCIEFCREENEEDGVSEFSPSQKEEDSVYEYLKPLIESGILPCPDDFEWLHLDNPVLRMVYCDSYLILSLPYKEGQDKSKWTASYQTKVSGTQIKVFAFPDELNDIFTLARECFE